MRSVNKKRDQLSPNRPQNRLSEEATRDAFKNVLKQHKYEGIKGESWDDEEGFFHSCSCSWKGSYRELDWENHGQWLHAEHLADVFTRLGFRKLSMVEIMDLTEPERMNIAREKVQARGADARKQLQLQAKVDELNSIMEDLVSSYDGPLMCMDKCGNPKCRDDIRIGAIEEVLSWTKNRAQALQAELDELTKNEEDENGESSNS